MIQTIIFDFGNVVGFFDHRLVSSRLRPHAAVPAEEIKPEAAEEALRAAHLPVPTPEARDAQLKAQERARAQLRIAHRLHEG